MNCLHRTEFGLQLVIQLIKRIEHTTGSKRQHETSKLNVMVIFRLIAVKHTVKQHILERVS